MSCVLRLNAKYSFDIFVLGLGLFEMVGGKMHMSNVSTHDGGAVFFQPLSKGQKLGAIAATTAI